MPYQAVMAKDGTLYAGLQDNGELRTVADGSEFNTHDGDGTWSAVDPDDSNVVYERQPQARAPEELGRRQELVLRRPQPSDTFQFVNPFSMDPTDASHLLDAGNKVWESKDGGGTWTSPFTLGTSPAGVRLRDVGDRPAQRALRHPAPTGAHTPRTSRTRRAQAPFRRARPATPGRRGAQHV
jgi:hypothetical protein